MEGALRVTLPAVSLKVGSALKSFCMAIAMHVK